MKHSRIQKGAALCAGLALATVAVVATAGTSFAGGNAQATLAPLDPTTESFTFNAPNQVQRYRVTCATSNTLTVAIADCCFAGDHFRATATVYDNKPSLGVVQATGVPDAYKNVQVVGSTPLTALVEITYPHGLNDFPAGGSVKLVCNKAGDVPSIEDLGLSDY